MFDTDHQALTLASESIVQDGIVCHLFHQAIHCEKKLICDQQSSHDHGTDASGVPRSILVISDEAIRSAASAVHPRFGRCPYVGQILPQIRDDRQRDRSREASFHVLG